RRPPHARGPNPAALSLGCSSKPDEPEWRARLEVEHDNLRTALRWLIREADAEGARAMAASMWRFWQTGPLSPGRRWLSEVLAQHRGVCHVGQLALPSGGGARHRQRLGRRQSQSIYSIEGGGFVALGQRRVVEHGVDEVFDRAAESKHRLAYVNQLAGALADNVRSQ